MAWGLWDAVEEQGALVVWVCGMGAGKSCGRAGCCGCLGVWHEGWGELWKSRGL